MDWTIPTVIPSLLGALLLTALAGLLWVLGFRAIRKRSQVKQWAREPGIIRDHRTRSFSPTSPTFIDFQVAFRFGGQEHLVWCASPTRSGYGPGSGKGVENEISSRPTGSAVQIYVNPENPQEAYLTLPEQHIIVFMLGGALMIGAIAATVALQPFGLLPPELLALGFFAVVGIFLIGVTISTTVALFHAPRRARPTAGQRTKKGSWPRRPGAR